jgi:hypothetical protein
MFSFARLISSKSSNDRRELVIYLNTVYEFSIFIKLLKSSNISSLCIHYTYPLIDSINTCFGYSNYEIDYIKKGSLGLLKRHRLLANEKSDFYRVQANYLSKISPKFTITISISYDFLDLDSIPTYKNGSNSNYNFNGKRIKTKVYESFQHGFIHADVNGASNILRKHFSNAFANLDLSYLQQTPIGVNGKSYLS